MKGKKKILVVECKFIWSLQLLSLASFAQIISLLAITAM